MAFKFVHRQCQTLRQSLRRSQTRIGHTKKQLHDFLASESGVVFCGRRFKFLYEHDERVHLFAPIDSEADGDGDLNLEGEVPLAMRSREALLDWIGVLDEVNPSKRSDRISMAFTPTVFVQTLRKDQVQAMFPDPKSAKLHGRDTPYTGQRCPETDIAVLWIQVRVLDDVMSEDGRYCFTDGCGSYGRDIQAALERYHPDGQMVCAIQVRCTLKSNTRLPFPGSTVRWVGLSRRTLTSDECGRRRGHICET